MTYNFHFKQRISIATNYDCMTFFFVEPSATQLIVQFLERSGLGSIILVECLLWDMIQIFFTKLSKFNMLIFLSIYILASATKKVPAMTTKVVCSNMYVTDFTLCCYFNFNPCARIFIDKMSTVNLPNIWHIHSPGCSPFYIF